MPHQPGDVLKRLVKLPRDPAGCWEWLGVTNNKGVPMKTFNGAPIAARRWLWEQLFGKLPHAMIVFGTCGNLNCLSPFHMKAGFDADKTQLQLGMFTPGDVEEIKAAAKQGLYARTALAMKLGVEPERLRDIWRGDTYGKPKKRKARCTTSPSGSPPSSPSCSTASPVSAA